MKYELLIGLRYVRARRRAAGRNGFISFISMVSMLGIALGVAALIVVLSVMNGFQRELRERILGVAAHAQVVAYEGDLPNWQQAADIAQAYPGVRAVAPFVQQQGMLSLGETARGTLVRGVLPEAENRVANFADKMKAGKLTDLKPGEFGIILGSDLAKSMGILPGEKITLIAPTGLVTPAAILPRLKQFTLVGVFDTGMYEYDAGLALIHMQDAQALYRMGDSVSGVRLALNDLYAAPRIARELLSRLDPSVGVTDWTRSHANFFRAVQMEKKVMSIILSLIVAVAAFNIVSTLVMAVQDKQADIAILRTLGASPRSIMVVFVIQGAIMGLIGLGIGVTGGVLLALNLETVVPAIERALGLQFLAKDVYFISDLPSQLLWGDVFTITAMAFVVTLLATLYPSWRAARINPAEALRYE
ncbi:lipoprotein-releasing ABC transporter permease subunit [Niveibacterium sp. 24ML]|uniref:lipoprotein-releasing ABC transporter permease subunit n=1 Tax=Niveibacterium sp. 24ML TaxID=2985512 RepID=UPI0022703CAC|nr:lipoprotein-releasing ABC transporter permease subunit [Niveibacterium sp. 24ML]MCX9158341.1 lipoprotein-releasing ABC transporter permease subunit [Niveibacterium sp. 24ML]